MTETNELLRMHATQLMDNLQSMGACDTYVELARKKCEKAARLHRLGYITQEEGDKIIEDTARGILDIGYYSYPTGKMFKIEERTNVRNPLDKDYLTYERLFDSYKGRTYWKLLGVGSRDRCLAYIEKNGKQQEM